MRARREIDREAIEHHYDLSNDFYSLFLDERMVYTCAYFRGPDVDLDTAQADKLELVCRKLRLRPGDTLLDVGCGWGSLALWAAKHHGARVLGVTLSAEQARFAQETIAREGLAERCSVECRDWRDTAGRGPFDRIAALGIVEHVGIANYPAFFRQLHDLLRAGGLLLNHGITRDHAWRHTPQWDFILAHVFPNGELDTLSHTCLEIEAAGLEILDVEGLRAHYARTCRLWVERLRANEGRAIELVGRRRYRTWLLYLTSASVGFEERSIGLHQVLARRPDPASDLDLVTRDEVYAPAK